MKKDEILNASRKEHRNKDLAEMEVVYQAGSHASRVGAFAVIFCACSYYDLQSVGYILQHYCNTMVSSFYQNEAKERFGLDCSVFCAFHFGICWIC